MVRLQSAAVEAETKADVAIRELPSLSTASFTADKGSFWEDYRIRGYEVSPDQRATIVTVANLLQEVAGNHAVGLWGRTDEGFASLPDMKDLLFVMTRLQIRMYEYPKWGDVVNVETYFTEEGRLAFRREWQMLNAATRKVMGAATSTWVTINTSSRRLIKPPDEMRTRFLRFTPPSTRQVLPPAETKKKLPDFDMPGQVQGPKQVARRSDMDMNGHINNVTYLAWTLESVPESVYDSYSLYEIEVDFKAECKAGDTIEAHCNPLGPEQQHQAGAEGANGNGAAAAAGHSGDQEEVQLLHLLQKCDENGCKELVRARTLWRKRKH
ncbi:hypothetical protein GPECTOR_78g79 [Gonium pectorale]|uniref:Acyl-[acyl-carrier-protein] hydrolase n=1 Tax=Gonium pectorale TaxID=33097 RepID=A0A150G256_GONPE|nr:hypothetical protein GPECTOR_78g79 [Gonium pectorale]|eukprot:KXZ43891.1 hypothetical protein GPECTOR_78g79 [Gonium pectorale]